LGSIWRIFSQSTADQHDQKGLEKAAFTLEMAFSDKIPDESNCTVIEVFADALQIPLTVSCIKYTLDDQLGYISSNKV
jgi:hypothetical protein